MQLPDWVITFLPQWESAVWIVLATAAVGQAWKLWRKDLHPEHRAPRGYACAAFSMGVGSALGILVVWAETRDATVALATGIKIGLASPVIWAGMIGFARRYVTWFAAAIGEDRRNGDREPGTWTQEHRARRLFEDTESMRVDAVRQWREESAKKARDG